jgi:aspartate carbamoyltransferase regulatory subunit
VISLIAPEATINIIREFDVVEKNRVDRPETVIGLLSCPNRNCITNANEPVETKFDVVDEGVRCAYCGTIIREELATHIDPE